MTFPRSGDLRRRGGEASSRPAPDDACDGGPWMARPSLKNAGPRATDTLATTTASDE
jgi:hypothetical protein